MTNTANKKASPLLRQHLRDLATKDFGAGLPPQPKPPQRPSRIQKPMSHAMSGRVFVDGQSVGPTPDAWAKPRQQQQITTTTTPVEESDEDRRARIKQEKKLERELMQMRSEVRWESERARAATTPPRRPLSPAVRNHFMASLLRPDPELED